MARNDEALGAALHVSLLPNTFLQSFEVEQMLKRKGCLLHGAIFSA